MAESPFKITRSDDGLSVRCEFDAHYVSDEDAQRIMSYVNELRDENAKLRELVRDMWHEGAFEPGACYEKAAERLEERTRELGIEVDG